MKNVISIRDFSRNDLDSLIEEALELKQKGSTNPLDQKKIASLFFENSTRTRISSETAARDLGGYINGFSGAEGTSVKKGEPLIDTLKMFEGYGYEAIIMRHNLEGAPRHAANNLNIPIINGGDGSNNHPTQTLLDLMTIKENFGIIYGLKIALVGDLKYGRTVHSLLQALESYNVEPWLVSPENLSMQDWRIKDFESNTNNRVVINPDLIDTIRNVDVLYMTRIQRERFPEGAEGELEYQKVSGIYNLTADLLKHAKKEMIVLHPLPRYKHNLEISMDVDHTPHAKYFEQAKNGMYMREAILSRIFGDGFEGREPKEQNNQELWKDVPIKNGRKIGRNFLYRIDNGTLIDHIQPGRGDSVLKVLGMQEYHETPMIHAKNLNSARYSKKDIIGFQDKELSAKELSKLALVADATVNIIRDKKVFKKGMLILPNELENLIQCQNPRCITAPEHFEHTPSLFYVEQRVPLKVRCGYCETPATRKEIALI